MMIWLLLITLVGTFQGAHSDRYNCSITQESGQTSIEEGGLIHSSPHHPCSSVLPSRSSDTALFLFIDSAKLFVDHDMSHELLEIRHRVHGIYWGNSQTGHREANCRVYGSNITDIDILAITDFMKESNEITGRSCTAWYFDQRPVKQIWFDTRGMKNSILYHFFSEHSKGVKDYPAVKAVYIAVIITMGTLLVIIAAVVFGVFKRHQTVGGQSTPSDARQMQNDGHLNRSYAANKSGSENVYSPESGTYPIYSNVLMPTRGIDDNAANSRRLPPPHKGNRERAPTEGTVYTTEYPKTVSIPIAGSNEVQLYDIPRPVAGPGGGVPKVPQKRSEI